MRITRGVPSWGNKLLAAANDVKHCPVTGVRTELISMLFGKFDGTISMCILQRRTTGVVVVGRSRIR